MGLIGLCVFVFGHLLLIMFIQYGNWNQPAIGNTADACFAIIYFANADLLLRKSLHVTDIPLASLPQMLNPSTTVHGHNKPNFIGKGMGERSARDDRRYIIEGSSAKGYSQAA